MGRFSMWMAGLWLILVSSLRACLKIGIVRKTGVRCHADWCGFYTGFFAVCLEGVF